MSTWKQFAVSTAAAVVALFIYWWALSQGASFCLPEEGLLTCARQWSNVVAIVIGAAVIFVTVEGQKQEAFRHKESIKAARAPDALRAGRTIVISSRLDHFSLHIGYCVERSLRTGRPKEIPTLINIAKDAREFLASNELSDVKSIFDETAMSLLVRLIGTLDQIADKSEEFYELRYITPVDPEYHQQRQEDIVVEIFLPSQGVGMIAKSLSEHLGNIRKSYE